MVSNKTQMISGGQKSTSRRERSRQQLVRKLLPSVEAFLAEGMGYTDVSVDDIIERAEVPRSTFYYHFKDKGELLIAVSADAMEQIASQSNELYGEGVHRSRRQFNTVIKKTVAAWVEHVALMNALAEVAAYNPAVKEQFLSGWRHAQQGATEHIRSGQKAGFVRADLDPEYVAAWLTWMCERGVGQLVAPAPAEQVDAIVAALATTVWHTLYPDTT